jgi:hypothetical protein
MSELKTITKSSSTQAKRAALNHDHSHAAHH